ncbi:MAG TPA: ABC transporter ATP-binding protein [Anaerolineaceae bacterium]|nr:ABC transporter ATP-binding protein [Anaerolineaceae bacterium]
MQFWFDLLKSGFSRRLPEDPVSGKLAGTKKVNLTLLKPYLKRHWKKASIGVAAIILTTLLAFPIPMINRYLVDEVILGKRLDMLLWTVLALAAAKGLSVLAGMAEQFLFTRLQMDVSLDMQDSLLSHTLQLPKSFFDDKEVGYLMSRIVSDVNGLNWFFSQNMVYIFTNILRFIGGVVFLFILEWRLALVTLFAIPFLVIIVNAFSKKIHTLSHYSMEQHARVSSRFQETLSSIPLIKAFVSEEKESQRVINEIRSAQQITLEQTVLGSVAGSLINLMPDISKAVILVAGAYLIIQNDWTLGSLLAFQSYIGYVFGPALALASTNLQLQNALASLERVSALMEVVPEEVSGSGRQVDHLQGRVAFEHVTFNYGQNENVLEDIHFTVQPGEKVAIVGSSGVGKTTLISLLLRFYKPSSGQVLYDGIPAEDFALDSLRQRIGYISQSTLLMASTIRENICYGNPGASEAEIERAARVAGIYDFINSLPDKFGSHVGEKGVNLSEGQKQRIAIARALLKEPDILIMDEPTASLDTVVEKSIFDALPAEIEGKTLFIAAHRLSTIQRADRILLLKDKHLVAGGTHAELSQADPYYRSLVGES